MRPRNICLILFLLAGIVFVSGCSDHSTLDTGATQQQEAKITEDTQTKLIQAVPPPVMTTSLERVNLKKRLEFLNKDDGMLYVALLSNDGKVLATYVTHKVSSVNSLLTTPNQIVPDPFYTSGNNHGLVVSSPDLDGSYGTNGNGIFFFTTDGAYIEWNGLYLESSQPFTLNTPPVLTKST